MAGASRSWAVVGLCTLAAGCANLSYSPCPVELDGPMRADAFDITKQVLAARFGSLAFVDAATFRLQTGWVHAEGHAGQRRATVFRDGDGLELIVEVRSIHEPLIGLPHWGPSRGDSVAERELAAILGRELSPERR